MERRCNWMSAISVLFVFHRSFTIRSAVSYLPCSLTAVPPLHAVSIALVVQTTQTPTVVCHFLGVLYIFLGQAWAEGRWCIHRRGPGRSHVINDIVK